MRSRANRLHGQGRTLAWDSFTGPDGTALPQHPSDSGHVWRTHAEIGTFGYATIQSGALQHPATVTSMIIECRRRLRRRSVKVSADIFVADAATNNDLAGVIALVADQFNSTFVGARGRYFHLGGVWQLLNTATATSVQALTLNQHYRLTLEARRGTIFIRIDNGDPLLVVNNTVKNGHMVGIGTQNGVLTPATMRLTNWMAER